MTLTRRLRVRGQGSAEVAAYGIADAEHQVEKELSAAWPGAAVVVVEIERPAAERRLVEEFVVRYTVAGEMQGEGDSVAEAHRDALRRLRATFAGTRHHRIAWDPPPESPPRG